MSDYIWQQATIVLPLTREGTEKLLVGIMDVLVQPGVLRAGYVDADVSGVLSEGQITIQWALVCDDEVSG